MAALIAWQWQLSTASPRDRLREKGIPVVDTILAMRRFLKTGDSVVHKTATTIITTTTAVAAADTIERRGARDVRMPSYSLIQGGTGHSFTVRRA